MTGIKLHFEEPPVPADHGANEAEHMHEFGHVDHIVHIEKEFNHKFIQTPTIHQYIKAGRIHRQKGKRPVGQFELFLDLVMVGVVHQLADLASETETGLAVARFVLTFWGAWSIWSDYRNYVNTSAMDDFMQRIYTFCMMAILIGYSANSTGVEIEDGHYVDNSSTHSSMRGAVGFLLVAKCIRFILHVFYAFYLPEFFLDQMVLAIWMLVASGLYLGSMFTPTIQTGTILFGAAGIVENFQLFFGVLLNRTVAKFQAKICDVETVSWFQDKVKRASVAVVNIEHAADRNGAFFTIVLGESVTNLLYQVAKFPHSAGVSVYYGRAFCVLLVSFNLNWLYFTDDWTVSKIHPVRRRWTTAIIYTFLHWPLAGGIIVASASVAQLVHPTTVEQGASQSGRYYWGAGIGVALLCLTILDLLPRWDYWTYDRFLVQLIRTMFRLGCVAICVTVPLANHNALTNLGFVGVYASVFVFLVGEEVIGKLVIMTRTKERIARAKAAKQECPPQAEDKNVSTDANAIGSDDGQFAVDEDDECEDADGELEAVTSSGRVTQESTAKPLARHQSSGRTGSVSSVSSIESGYAGNYSGTQSDAKTSGTVSDSHGSS